VTPRGDVLSSRGAASLALHLARHYDASSGFSAREPFAAVAS